MKLNRIAFVCALLALLIAAACSKKEESKEAADEWKEMDDFHMIMADVFHPLKDSGNLEPIKAKAEELATSASMWAEATLPSKVDTEEIKGMLMKLKNGATDLAADIKNGADDGTIQSELTELHEMFHHLQEKWYEEEEGHHEQH